MRVCLIHPPFITYGSIPRVFQPLGLAYIAGVLEKDHQVSVIDALGEGWKNLRVSKSRNRMGLEIDEITSRVKRLAPEVVGITVPSIHGVESAFEVSHAVKGIDKNIIVVFGGPHPTIKPLDFLTRGDVDFVVIGEGEDTVTELIHVLERGAKDELKNVRGLAYLENGQPIITPARPLITNLDLIPFPARHLLPMDAYTQAARKGAAASGIAEPRVSPWATIYSSRGCPYNCVFCSIHIVMGKKYRARSAENVVEEIKQLCNAYGVRHIEFHDDNLTLNRERTHRICDLIIEKGLDIEWYAPNGIRADTVDENLLIKMKRSGCKELWFAPESGVQRVVDQIIKKKLDLKRVDEAVTICKRLGIRVNIFLMMGLIGETKEDIRKTIEYGRKLKRLGASKVQVPIAIPYYGTELYEQAKEEGLLVQPFDEKKLGKGENALIETPEFTAQELIDFSMQARAIYSPLTRETLNRHYLAWAIRNPWLNIRGFLRRVRYMLKAKLTGKGLE